jgi:uncharacterized protein (TIGR02996 family)
VPPSLSALRARPHDREQLTVYADWLQTQGHPRGELIALQLLEAECAELDEFVGARARARALVRSEAELRPPMPGDDGAPSRGVWASWERGFVRRLELRIDEPSPGAGRSEFGSGPTGWAELFAAIMAHPSLALVEHVLLRFDLRGEPLDETAFALDVATRGLARWRAEGGPRPPFQLDLWTQRVPGFGARERLVAALPELQSSWFAHDMTLVPPPPRSPAFELERRLAGLDYGAPTAFDLLWFDARGHFLARIEAHAWIDDGTNEELADYGPHWQVHVRRMAERRGQAILDAHDPLPARRLAHLFDELAARFAPRGDLAPRAAPSPEPLELAAALERFAAFEMLPTLARESLEDFDQVVDWYWLDEPCGEQRWRGLVGLGDDQLLALAS